MAKRKKKMNSDIQIFCYKAMPVRTTEIDGETWFVAKDVCDILEIVNSRDAISNLDDDEKGVAKTDTPGGIQEMTIVSEAGLYTLLMRSNKEEAKPFRRWVTHDVLPSLRKTGSYVLSNTKQETMPDIHLPPGSIELAETIMRRARNANSDDDFEELAAMDNLFKDFTGKSALNAAGMFIMSMPQIDEVNRCYNTVTTEISYHYKLMGRPLPPLPASWTDEQTIDD